jgi:hypothetical protein
MYCRQLQQRLTEDLAVDAQEDGSNAPAVEDPGVHSMLTSMLQRVRSNLDWYEWKSCSYKAGPGEEEQQQCKKP